MACSISFLLVKYMSILFNTAKNFITYEDAIKLKDFLILNLIG